MNLYSHKGVLELSKDSKAPQNSTWTIRTTRIANDKRFMIFELTDYSGIYLQEIDGILVLSSQGFPKEFECKQDNQVNYYMSTDATTSQKLSLLSGEAYLSRGGYEGTDIESIRNIDSVDSMYDASWLIERSNSTCGINLIPLGRPG